MVNFQLDVVHNCPDKLSQKSMDEKSSPFVTQPSKGVIIHKPQNDSSSMKDPVYRRKGPLGELE
jgi:hypothetical protein